MVLEKRRFIQRCHLVGIGGVSMSALAKYLAGEGVSVSGSDLQRSERTEELEKLGVRFFLGHHKEQVEGAEVVVVSSAVKPDNEEICYALQKGIPVLSRTEAWHDIMARYLHSVGVAGSHGKTTCTAMLSHIFLAGGESFTSHIGGDDAELGNFANYGRVFFVTEACEYKRNLLNLIPETAILLNVDRDHMECYRGEDDLRETFFRFCREAKRAIVLADLPLEGGITFGIGKGDYRAVRLKERKERYSFLIEEYGKPLVRVRLKVMGRHNVLNALAACAAARQYGISPLFVKKGLEAFRGVKRRFEKIGTYRGAEVICDYAHHPREISAVLRTFEKRKKKLFIVFQPHTYSRTKLLFSDFVNALEGFRPVLYRTYPAREEYDEAGSAKTLSLAIKNSRYADSERELKSLMKEEVKGNMTVLFLGAGDVYDVAKRIIY